jgi:hypothetical protein
MTIEECAAVLLDAIDDLKAIPGRTVYQGAHQPLLEYRVQLTSWKADTKRLIRNHLGRDAATAFDAVADPGVVGVTTAILGDVIAKYETYLITLVALLRSGTAVSWGTTPLPVFCSYSSKDNAYRERLQVALAVPEREGLLRVWEFRQIEAGADWDADIRKHLHEAKLILLLVSPDFFDSGYTIEKELTTALQRHTEGSARVVPIIVRPCDWLNTELRTLQALPRDGKSVSEWSNPDAAWQNVTDGIRRVIQSMIGAAATTPSRPLLTSTQREVLEVYSTRRVRAGEGLPIAVFTGNRDTMDAIQQLIAMEILQTGKNNYVLLTNRGYAAMTTLQRLR